MPASSEHHTPSKPEPSGEHWSELTATLSGDFTQILGDWLNDELADLEGRLSKYVTPNSLRKSLRR